ncbi:hypothetical protein TrVFT333_011879 [Trichoderma virens FT-333]|nr:hypothetical protein TrVFT333_011879 [Trichoderma virens FT-333]
MSHEDAEFKRIRANVGSMLDEGGPAAYFRRLARQTARTDDFITWTRQQPIPHPSSLFPDTILSQLKSTKFVQLGVLLQLSIQLNRVAGGLIPLSQDKTRKLAVAPDTSALYIKPFQIPTEGSDSGSSAANIPQIHPCIVALRTATAEASVPSKAPKYVLPMGRLIYRDIRPIDEIPEEDQDGVDADPENRQWQLTNYAVVIDVTSADKGVWMIYNHKVFDEEIGDAVIDADPADDTYILFPAKEETHSEEGGAKDVNPQSAQIMPALSGWDVVPSTLAMDQFEKNFQSTREDIALEAIVPTLEEVNAVLSSL